MADENITARITQAFITLKYKDLAEQAAAYDLVKDALVLCGSHLAARCFRETFSEHTFTKIFRYWTWRTDLYLDHAPATKITSIKVDGTLVPSTDYSLENGRMVYYGNAFEPYKPIEVIWTCGYACEGWDDWTTPPPKTPLPWTVPYDIEYATYQLLQESGIDSSKPYGQNRQMLTQISYGADGEKQVFVRSKNPYVEAVVRKYMQRS